MASKTEYVIRRHDDGEELGRIHHDGSTFGAADPTLASLAESLNRRDITPSNIAEAGNGYWYVEAA